MILILIIVPQNLEILKEILGNKVQFPNHFLMKTLL